jgi:hypothetical protein
MNLRWVPSLGYYTGTGRFHRTVRHIEFKVTQQIRVDGVWTARKIVGTVRAWARGAPRYHSDGPIILERRGS